MNRNIMQDIFKNKKISMTEVVHNKQLNTNHNPYPSYKRALITRNHRKQIFQNIIKSYKRNFCKDNELSLINDTHGPQDSGVGGGW